MFIPVTSELIERHIVSHPRKPFSHMHCTVGKEIEYYKRKLEASRTEYKIVEQLEQPDGSVIVKFIKQYNYSPIGDYLK